MKLIAIIALTLLITTIRARAQTKIIGVWDANERFKKQLIVNEPINLSWIKNEVSNYEDGDYIIYIGDELTDLSAYKILDTISYYHIPDAYADFTSEKNNFSDLQKDSLLNGTWYLFWVKNKRAQPIVEKSIKSLLLDGIFKRYYPDGNVFSIISFKSGLIVGCSIFLNDDGTISNISFHNDPNDKDFLIYFNKSRLKDIERINSNGGSDTLYQFNILGKLTH